MWKLEILVNAGDEKNDMVKKVLSSLMKAMLEILNTLSVDVYGCVIYLAKEE